MTGPRRCVLLFARSPQAEARRKRLPGTEKVFVLAAQRVAAAAAAIGFDLVVVGEAVPKVAGRRFRQRGRTFAERLENALNDARALGYEQVLAVPGDVPGLGPTYLAEAAAALDRGRVVLGPSPDGGVCLLGLAGPAEGLLRGVRWQTRAVFDDLMSRAGGRVLVLSPLADLDTPRGLEALAREAKADPLVRRLLSEIRHAGLVRSPSVAVRPADRAFLLLDPLRGPPAFA